MNRKVHPLRLRLLLRLLLRRRLLLRLHHHYQRLIAGGLLIIISTAALGLFAPLISSQDPMSMALPERLAGPTWLHPFGQDENGADVFAKICFGARVSLGVAGSVILIGGSIGLIVGSIAGYSGGLTDQLIMRLIDMVYAFPSFLLALALVATLGASLRNLILALTLTSWTTFARLVRGEVMHLKALEFVQSARALGASHTRIVVRHIWPNILGLLIVQCTFSMAGTIIAESGLSFLGLGVPASTPTWGSVLQSGRRFLDVAPHISFSAGLAILSVVLGLNLLGDGLRELLDPRRGRNKI